MVFYLKYRPKTLEELDNQEVANLLGKYLQQTTLPHAFLFTGPKGTGKTSTARILAKSINCENKKKGNTACGVCEVCVSIAQGSNLDILEIDAASNRGIDEIRELREKIKLAPLHLKYKVYIIDEVHMLTTEAFNALLKTLEEPPPHAVFILATTEIHKVPDTIKSRCAKINFHKAEDEELLHALERITKSEGIKADKKILSEIAHAADGSFRDAAMLLESAALGTKELSADEVTAALGQIESTKINSFLELLQSKDAKKMLLLISQLEKEGKQLRQFYINIMKKMEELLLLSFSDQTNWSKAELIRALQLFMHHFTFFSTSPLASLPLQLAVVEYCNVKDSRQIEITKSLLPDVTEVSIASPGVVDVSATQILEKWPVIIEYAKKHNHSIAGVLRSCKPLSFSKDNFKLEAAYKFHADRLNDSKIREIIASILKEVMGWEGKLEVVIKKGN